MHENPIWEICLSSPVPRRRAGESCAMNFRPVSRRFAITILLASACSLAASEPAKPPIQFMPLAAAKPGMRGVAYTVLQGVKPQPMDVERLGVMMGDDGPRRAMLLIRLHGLEAE